MAKVIIHLRDHERTALNDAEQRGYRAPGSQAAPIIRRELQKPGMIPGEPPVATRPDDIPADCTDKLEMKGG
jgi:hypothetical protein